MHSEGFEPAIPAISLLQTHALDRTATGSEQKELRSPGIDPLRTYHKLFHHLAYIYSNIKYSTSSCAKCRLKPIAISWLRLKLQRVTSLPQTCSPPPAVHCHQAGRNCAMYLGGPCFIYWSGHSLYHQKYCMVLFIPSNHMPRQRLTRCQAIPSSSIILPFHST